MNALNQHNDTADSSYETFREWLKTGMHNKNLSRVSDDTLPAWQRARAQSILDNLDDEVENALPNWINQRLATTKHEMPYKVVRAHRRGLIFRKQSLQRRTYPAKWVDVARTIRLRDQFKCRICGTEDEELHVHHIIFRSKHGTNRRGNLITLCRDCHQDQHEHEFDPLETNFESGNVNPESPAELIADSGRNDIPTPMATLSSIQVDLNDSDQPQMPTHDLQTTAHTELHLRKAHPLEIIACIALVFVFLLVISSLR